MLSLKLHMNLMSAARESMWLFLEGGGGVKFKEKGCLLVRTVGTW